MDSLTESPVIACRYGFMCFRSAGYWLATGLVASELGLGGIWNIARLPFVRDLVTHLGYPSYFLRLSAPGRYLARWPCSSRAASLLKEWAYEVLFFYLHRGDRLPPDHRL